MKDRVSWFGRTGRTVRFVVFMAAVVFGPGGTVFADDHVYVLRDGTRVPLIRSKQEVGVVLRSRHLSREARVRLESAAKTRLRDLPKASRVPMKLLKFSDKGTAGLSVAALRADPAVKAVGAVYRFPGSDVPVIGSRRLVVKVRAGLSDAELLRLWNDYGLEDVQPFEGLDGVYLGRLADPTVDEADAAEALAADDRTVWANPDFYRATTAYQVVPSDEFFDLQWHLNNTGQTGGTPDADIDAVEAWVSATGAGVTFGIFDDGIDVDHEDLAENYLGIGRDLTLPLGVPDSDNPRPKTNTDAHGTAVMGLAVAAGNNVGVRGVAYQAKFTATRGLGSSITDSQVAATFTFSMDAGVDVHINSWGLLGSPPDPPVLVEAIDKAFREGRDPDGEGGRPPLGMVILFASGNEDTEVRPGFALSQLPQVIAVGATTDLDKRAGFSNWGPRVNILAPGGESENLGITTTDAQDGGVTDGYNLGGTAVVPGFNQALGPDIDPQGLYTGFFGGTSAACPIAAGVAGLVLSVNPNLTATDVRIILEHSTDRINPEEAAYDGITSRSVKYGYGRINAQKAVEAAKQSLENGGLTWPDVPTEVTVEDSTLTWLAGSGTDEFLVLETTGDFDLIPPDGTCYDNAQLGCGGAALAELPADARVLFVGCADGCAPGTKQSVPFERPLLGAKLFAIYARNSATGRYSFGTTAEAQAAIPPAVTISANPTSGRSPLTVHFNGNAVTDLPIDPNGIEWDFDATNLLRDNVTVNATTQSATFTYFAPAGQTLTFTARLTMRDIAGIAGTAEVLITVEGEELPDNNVVSTNDMEIVISLPGTPDSDITRGTSPLSVEMRVVSGNVGSVQSVIWDLGDGTTAEGLLVTHTYTNDDETPRTFVVAADVTTITNSGLPLRTTATKLLTVDPGPKFVDPGTPELPGTTPLGSGGRATPCGVLGAVPTALMFASLVSMRRRRRRMRR